MVFLSLVFGRVNKMSLMTLKNLDIEKDLVFEQQIIFIFLLLYRLLSSAKVLTFSFNFIDFGVQSNN